MQDVTPRPGRRRKTGVLLLDELDKMRAALRSLESNLEALEGIVQYHSDACHPSVLNSALRLSASAQNVATAFRSLHEGLALMRELPAEHRRRLRETA